jgi:transposase
VASIYKKYTPEFREEAAKMVVSSSERAKLRELERRNRDLEMENAFLKKAAAYFAKEQR